MLRFCWRAALVTLAISATSPGCAVDFGNPHRLISLHDNTSISSGQSGQFCQQETVPHLFIQIVFMRLIKFFTNKTVFNSLYIHRQIELGYCLNSLWFRYRSRTDTEGSAE
jgi:hypothetical protein